VALSRAGSGAVLCILGVGMISSACGAPSFQNGVSQGTVTAAAVNEASGIAASRDNGSVLWIHNDSGDVARVFAIDTQGHLLGTYNIMQEGTTTYATATDFEDIAVGPGPEPALSYVYVGDIGDNGAARANIGVYRIAEPAVYTRQSASPVTRNLNQGEWQRITLTYPDGAHNAETMMVDPWTGDLFIGTKQGGVTRVYRASAADMASGLPVVLTFVGEVGVDTSTGGDISPTGSEIAIRGYPSARLWTRAAGQTVAEALAGSPVVIPIASEPQGEAIGFDAIGLGYFTLSEGLNRPLYYYQRTSGDGPAPPTVFVAAGSSWKYLDKGSDQGTAWRAPGFDDSAWAGGEAQLGYGDGDEQTVVSFGPNASSRYTTTYFRKTFQIEDAASVASLTGRLVFDDGAAVYLNGIEILRMNLAAGASYDSLATGTQYAFENSWFTFSVDPNRLVDGTNTLAVEVHQVSPSSSDVSFDMQLFGVIRPRLRRLTLTETNAAWGDVLVQPEPNDANDMAYARGTAVTLTAAAVEGKAFRQWEVFDPNYPDDANHATIDANQTLTLVMDRDTHVNAVWMCGSGGSVVPLLLFSLALTGWKLNRGRRQNA
jgi:hypothetical protein